MNLLTSLRIIFPSLFVSLEKNHHLSKLEFFDLLPKDLPETDEEIMSIFYQLYAFYDLKKSENISPDFMLTMIWLYPGLIDRDKIISDIEMLFLLFETQEF